MRNAWTIVSAMSAAILWTTSATAQGVAPALGVPQAIAELVPMLPLMALAALAVGGLLRPTAGRWVAAFVTGGVVGFFVWWTAAIYELALLAALGAWLFALMGSLLWHSLGDRPLA